MRTTGTPVIALDVCNDALDPGLPASNVLQGRRTKSLTPEQALPDRDEAGPTGSGSGSSRGWTDLLPLTATPSPHKDHACGDRPEQEEYRSGDKTGHCSTADAGHKFTLSLRFIDEIGRLN
jgi:hypothetical protein